MSRLYTVQLTKVIVETVEAANETEAVALVLADSSGFGGAWDYCDPCAKVIEVRDGGAQ